MISERSLSNGSLGLVLAVLLLATLVSSTLLVLPCEDVVSADFAATPMVAAGNRFTVGLKSDGTVLVDPLTGRRWIGADTAVLSPEEEFLCHQFNSFPTIDSTHVLPFGH